MQRMCVLLLWRPSLSLGEVWIISPGDATESAGPYRQQPGLNLSRSGVPTGASLVRDSHSYVLVKAVALESNSAGDAIAKGA